MEKENNNLLTVPVPYVRPPHSVVIDFERDPAPPVIIDLRQNQQPSQAKIIGVVFGVACLFTLCMTVFVVWRAVNGVGY